MTFLGILSIFGLTSGALSGECKYSRKGGLFLNEFANPVDPEFGGAIAQDALPGSGNYIFVNFTNTLNILGHETKTLTVADNGFVGLGRFGPLDFSSSYFDPTASPRRGNFTDVPFAVSRWFNNNDLVVLQFSVEHIDRNKIVVGGNVEKSLCTLERIEAIISDCKGSTTEAAVEPYETIEVIEAAIITFKHEVTPAITLHQLVFAQTATTTYVLCLYQDHNLSNIESLLCYINGNYSVTPYWQGYCPAENGNFSKQSNCDCGNWNAGVYVFNTALRTDPDALNGECMDEFDDTCNVSSPDLHYLRNRYCRPAMEPVDTCREDLLCQMNATGGTGFSITLLFRDAPLYTEVVFLDRNQWMVSEDIVIKNLSICMGMIVDGEVTFEFDAATFGDCDIETNPDGTLDFVVMTRDANETQDLFIKDGYRILKGQCNYKDLVNQVTLSPDFGTFGNESIDTPAGRTVDLFVSTEYRLTTDPVNTKLPPNAVVYLGQDLFLTMCYEEGERPFQENAEPYGAWPSMCYVSNSPDFPADSNSVQLTNSAGCRMPQAQSANNAFYMQQEFKMTSNYASKLSGNTYEWCMTSGKIDAAKWVKSDIIFFRCYVNYCKNIAIRDSQSKTVLSKCMDACNGKTDAEAKRKRAIEDDVTIAKTSVRVVPVSENQTSEVTECTEMSVAIATIVSLLVLLLIAVCLTMLLVVKLQRHEKTVRLKAHRQ